MGSQTQTQALAAETTLTAAPSNVLQRTCACGQHTVAGGECAACRAQPMATLPNGLSLHNPGSDSLLRSADVHEDVRHAANFSRVRARSTGERTQTRLSVSQPGDEHEHEADRVADTVMRMPDTDLPDNRPALNLHSEPEARVQRQADSAHEEEDDEEEEVIHPKVVPGETPSMIPEIADRLDALRNGGAPLHPGVRGFFEPRFVHDFSQVRVHTDPEAGRLAQTLHAQAFARGQHIFFGPGRYQPDTPAGRQLLAHELTHTLQQRGSAAVVNTVQRRATTSSSATTLPAPPSALTPSEQTVVPPAAQTEPPAERQRATPPAPEAAQPADVPPPASAAAPAAPPAEPAAAAPPTEGEGSTALPEHITLDTSSESGILQSLATVPVSSFGQAMMAANQAVGDIQTRERMELATSLPEIDRPTGLPRLSERPTPPPTQVEEGRPSEAEPPGLREAPPAATEHQEARGPLPAAQVQTQVEEPSDDGSGSWWDWIFSAVRRFLGQLPTSDPTLNTSAGERPNVDTTGNADPAQNERQQRASEQGVGERRANADAATRADFGENNIYPDAPHETMQPNYTPGTPEGGPSAEIGEPGVPNAVRTGFDQAGAGWLHGEVGQRLEQERQDRADYERDSKEKRADSQRQIDAETARIRSQQEDTQNGARQQVREQREQWREENRSIQETYGDQAVTRRQEVDRQIGDKIRTTEERADQELSSAENQAAEKQRQAERQAEAKRREAENKPRSFWDRVRGAVSDFFDALKEAVNDLFNKLRQFVRDLIERAKRAVREWIEAAWQAIVGFIRGFGEFLKGIVSVALAAFPEAAERARRWIDNRVDDAVEVVNRAAAALQEFAQQMLDALGAALDFILSVYQRVYLALIEGLRLLTVGLIEIMERIGHLVEAAGQMPDHFLGQVSEELIGQDLTQALPFERTALPTPAAAVATAVATGAMAPADATALTQTTFTDADIAVDQVAPLELSPELLASLNLQEGEERQFGEEGDPSRTIAAIQDELTGGEEETALAPAAGAPTTSAPEQPATAPGAAGIAPDTEPGAAEPVTALSPEEETEQRLQKMMDVEPDPPCPKEASSEKAEQSAVPEEMKFGPLSIGQRARYLTNQMIKGVRNWFSCNWPWLLAAAIGVLVVLIVAEILTGGAITAALPPLMGLIALIMIGVAAVRVAAYVGEYLSKGWGGDIAGAARSLARGLAVGAIELIFTLLFDLNAVIKAAKQGLTATIRGALATARRATRTLARSATRIGRAAVRTVRTPGRAAALVGRVVVRRGRLIFQGVRRGFARGVRSLDDLAKRLWNAVRFRRFSFTLRNRMLTLWGHINPRVKLAEVLLPEVERAIAAQGRAENLRRVLQSERRLGSSAVAAVEGVSSAWTVSKFGRQADELFELARTRPDLHGLLSGSQMTEDVVRETLAMAERLNLTPAQLGGVVGDLPLLRSLSSHAERQLAVAAGESTRALGVSRNLCGDCPHFFSGLARTRGRGIVIADPSHVWVFLKNGRYADLPRSAVAPILGAPDAARRLAALLEQARL